jgi:hypothetical protein
MSEFTNRREYRTSFRWQLLATVSGIALLGFAYETDQARATDSASLWIELGGQFAQNESDQEAFLPPFLLTTPRPPFDAASPAELEKGAPSGWAGTAKIAFEPAGTDWVFSVGVRYGTNGRNNTRNQKTAQLSAGGFQAFYEAYQNIAARETKSHAILDFQAGKDVGLGRFGSGGSSVFSVGLRYAQFNSRSLVGIQSQPTNIAPAYGSYHKFNAILAAKRKFTGIGPSLSWDASAGLIGDSSAGNISLDWGVNGALLFGRQRAQVHHQTGDVLHVPYTPTHSSDFVPIPVYQHSASPDRSKQVTVPNFGGFAGVSWRYPNAKVTLGYRADFFFGAMDGGIDTVRRENVGFYGPFASVSIGVGG